MYISMGDCRFPKVFIMCTCVCYLYVIMFVHLSVLCLHVCETICISVVIRQLQQKKYPTSWWPHPCLLPIGPTSRRDSLLCKLSTSRPKLSFSSCFSASSCCSSWTCREGVVVSVALQAETPGSWGSTSSHLPPYLSLQAVEGAGLCLWQLTEEVGTALRSGLGASPAHLLLSDRPSPLQMSSGLFCARTPLEPLTHSFMHAFIYYHYFWLCSVAFGILVPQPGIKSMLPAVAQSLNHWTTRELLSHSFIHSLTHSNIHSSSKYLLGSYGERGTINQTCPCGFRGK